jgi:hypothetical protein
MRGFAIAIAGCVVAIGATRASADPAQAKALFDEGRKLVEAADKVSDPLAKADKVSAACDKFAASLAQDAQLGTKLNLADCRIRQGKLIEAYAILDDAASEAERTHDREAFAKQQLAALAKKLVRVRVHVTDPDLAGMSIILNNRHLAHDDWTRPQVVAPGPIVVEVSAPDHKPARLTDNGAAGAEVRITVPALESTGTTTVETPSPVVPTEQHDRSKVPYVVIAGGGALVVTSAILGLHAHSRYATAYDAGNMAGVTSAQHEADLATVFVAAGAVAVGVGIWLYVQDTPADKPAVTAIVNRDTLGLALIGSF